MENVEDAITKLAGSTDRGGVISGHSPVHSAIQLYLIQIILIVVLCFALGIIVKRWNQPRVIAEVMAGVLLGPSALGIIPGFTDTLFPDDSLEALTMTAHLGLVLFLFIIGLELDPSLLRSNAKKATILSLTGQGVTWILSLGVSYAMMTWLDGVDSSTSFVLFIGVSLSVTAFPVLSRILTENHLLNTNVGALVISAASVDEACVWCLLALVVSTINAGSPLDAFYVFLLLLLFVSIMLTVVRWAVLRLVRQIGGDSEGTPARGVVILCFLLTLISAWVTDFIGIDAIFGAFVAGIIVPREHSLHVRIVDLVQDVVSALLLPLYFAVSGLKTDVTLLDNGTSWGICVLTICAACLGKIGGGAACSALALGMNPRESAAVGVLMNTRGLVELIILNIGLDAEVLTKEVMAIMVVMALVTTFMTAPLSSAIYPIKYHTLPGNKFSRRTKVDSVGVSEGGVRSLASIPDLGVFAQQRLKLLMLVSNSTGLDAVTRVAGLFNGTSGSAVAQQRRVDLAGAAAPPRGAELEVHALRLLENTDRFSSDMRAVERGLTLTNDSLTGILKGFLELMRIKVHTHISVGSTTDYCQDVKRITDEFGISTMVFPWEISSTGIVHQLARTDALLDQAQCQVVIAINCHRWSVTPAVARGQIRILVPFFGGKDDVAALLLALAIVKSDTLADLVILSFIEPHKVPEAASSSRIEAGLTVTREEDSGEVPDSRRTTGSQQSAGAATESRQGGEFKDIEAGGGDLCGDLRADFPPTPPVRAGSVPAPFPPSHEASNRGAASLEGRSQYLPGGWSGRELMKMADSIERVTVTPAWSIQAEIGAAAEVPSSPAVAPVSPSARVVQQFVATQSMGLVICGCAGSGHLSPGLIPPHQPEHGGGGPAASAPMSGGVAGQQRPKTASLGPLNVSRRGLTWQTWHAGKTSSRHGPGGRKRLRSFSRSISNVPPIDHDAPADAAFGPQGALDPLVGDVVSVLMRSDRSPAVLAVRASLTSL